MQHHKWNLTELEDMLPYERDIYVSLLKNWIEEENEKIQNQQTNQQKHMERHLETSFPFVFADPKSIQEGTTIMTKSLSPISY